MPDPETGFARLTQLHVRAVRDAYWTGFFTGSAAVLIGYSTLQLALRAGLILDFIARTKAFG